MFIRNFRFKKTLGIHILATYILSNELLCIFGKIENYLSNSKTENLI